MLVFASGMVTLLFLSAGALCAGKESIEAEVCLYKNSAPSTPTVRFSPGDTIVLRVGFKNLPAGDYTFHADWYNAKGELQETSRYAFTLKDKGKEILETQLNLIKASPLRRLVSASEATGYHMKFFGKWQVKLYLNGEEITHKHFTIQ